MSRRWLVFACALAAVGVVASASAQNQRSLHYSMTVTLAGGGKGSVYGCSELPFLGPNPPNSTNPGYTFPPCINPGAEDACGDASKACGWSPFNAGTAVTRDLSNPKAGAASLNVSASANAQGVADCITQGLSQGSHDLSFWYRTTSASATSVYAQVRWYSDAGCSSLISSSPLVGSSSVDTTGTWSQFSNTLTAPQFTNAGRVVVAVTGSNVAANFDEIILAPLVAGRTIDCPGRCSTTAAIQPDKNFTLVAVPAPGSSFVGWSGTCSYNPQFAPACTACSGSNVVCTLSEQEGVSDEQATATFGTPTLVTVRSMVTKRREGGVAVRWRTGSDAGILGFDVYRELKSGLRAKVNRTLLKASSAPAARAYRFLDRTAPRRGRLRYWIEERLLTGSAHWYGPIAIP
jgi:hypothetical protein